MTTFGDRLLYWLRELDVTQAELADRMELGKSGRSAVAHWVRGDWTPTYANIELIAKALGIDLQTFFARHVQAA